MSTPAQEEFNALVNNSNASHSNAHPEDRDHFDKEGDRSGEDSDDSTFRELEREANTLPPSRPNMHVNNLPHESFSRGRQTGVKGVIEDARHYEIQRRASNKWTMRLQNARRSIFGGLDNTMGPTFTTSSRRQGTGSDRSDNSDNESCTSEEEFRANFSREQQVKYAEQEAQDGSKVRTRRTSPSMRMYGTLIDVESADGYLDAIMKVGRETVVVVFVYDASSKVCRIIERALRSIATANPAVRFVKVPYEALDFDAVAVPAILGYRDQGDDLFANLTAVLEMMPEDADCDEETLTALLIKHDVLRR